MTQLMNEEREFHVKVLGRTLEHLGAQMYKQRDAALAELVANAWDANAANVWLTVPTVESYNKATSEIQIRDDGDGMGAADVEDAYLVVGRNRRKGAGGPGARPVMGRKGIGKLAGFGIAARMEVTTVHAGIRTHLVLDADSLKLDDGQVEDVPIPGQVSEAPGETQGTTITLTGLKAKTPITIGALREAIARRFSRSVKGGMNIFVNGEKVADPKYTFTHREPETPDDFHEETLPDGNTVRWWAGFSETVIPNRNARGFAVMVRGKVAQSPDFYFDVEGTASGQHGTKYLVGDIEADYLDEGSDDTSDVVSTDRQHIDWDEERTTPLYKWGADLTRRLLREHAARGAEKIEKAVLNDAELASRIVQLDETTRKQALATIKKVSGLDVSSAKARDFADTIIRAFEYRQFHDFVQEFDQVGDDPEKLEQMLDHLSKWRALEGRAVLEIIKGRIEIVEKFHGMILNDASETAGYVGADNLHDLIASYPWLLNPEWQVLAEERGITTQLREWGDSDLAADVRGRYDFLALDDERQLVVVEIKRGGHTPTLEDFQQLERYKSKLSGAGREVRGLFIAAVGAAMDPATLKEWQDRPSIDIRTWAEVHERVSRHYRHYREVLEGDAASEGFDRKRREVARSREVLGSGTAYRGSALRREGLGPQDASPDE